MRNFARKAGLAAIIFLLFILTGHDSMAQQIPKADNSVHDRMYHMMQQSEKVALPATLVTRLNTINAADPNKAKIIWAQTALLKVMYNTALPKDDIIFFGKEILKNESNVYTPIHSDIKKVLEKL
jgi:hypothetical protein